MNKRYSLGPLNFMSVKQQERFSRIKMVQNKTSEQMLSLFPLETANDLMCSFSCCAQLWKLEHFKCFKCPS